MPLNGTSALNEWKKKNKRKRLPSFEQQQSRQITEAVTEIKQCRVWNLQLSNEKVNNSLLHKNLRSKIKFQVFPPFFPLQMHMPAVRRSQKLSDKITALQKLVSPYGKVSFKYFKRTYFIWLM